MLRACFYLVLAAVCLAGAGCGRVHQLYYLQGTFEPGDADGLYLDEAYVSPEIASIKGKSIVVQIEDPAKTINQEVSKISPKEDEADNFWDVLRTRFEQRLANEIWRANIFSDLCAAGDATRIQQPDLILKVAITQWHEGNKWTRALFGFGLGRTRVQWEGAIIEPGTDRLYFSFADARIHPGGSWLGFSRRAWRGSFLIQDDLLVGGEDLADTLREVTETTEPQLPLSEIRPFRHKVKPAAPAGKTAPRRARKSPVVPGSVTDGQGRVSEN